MAMEDRPVKSTTTPHQDQHIRPRMLRPLLMTCALFSAAMCTSRALRPAVGRPTDYSIAEHDSTLAVPHQHPTGDVLFHTTDCANPHTAPVMQGVDLVKYFALQPGELAVAGTAEHVAVHEGYQYWFSSEENKSSFQEQPSRYIPKWGGFCAWGISEETSWTSFTLGPPTNPDSWLVTADDELYLFRSDWNKDLFVEDIAACTEAGNARWGAWFGDGTTSSSEQPSPLDTDCFCSTEGDDLSDNFSEKCVCGGVSC